MKPFALGVCLAALAATAATPCRAGDDVVLFWRLSSLGVEAETAVRIEQVLQAEIHRVAGVRLVSREEIAASLESSELAQCQGELACLTELGRIGRASRVVSGVLGMLGDMFSLDIKLIDVPSGQEIRRVAQTWSGEETFSIEVMRQVATRLLRPEAYKGRLSLTTNVPGVKIFVDGDFIWRTPLDEPLVLSPGRHALKLVCAGFRDFERFVDVPFDRTVPVVVELQGSGLSGVVSAEKAEDRFALGVKGGLVTDFGPFLAPQAGLELGVRLPFWGGRLAVMVETGAYGVTATRTGSDSSLGKLTVDAGILVWPIQLSVLVRLLPDYPFGPYVGGGGGFFVVWQSLTGEGMPEQVFRDGVFGFQFLGGLEYRLGPGVVFLEARYQHLRLDGAGSDGGVEGLLGGLGLGLGYRLMLGGF